MGEAFIVRRGGGNLNFECKVYASEADVLAATPTKMQIAVVTATKVSAFSVQASKPSVTQEGYVWIVDDASQWQSTYIPAIVKAAAPPIQIEIYPRKVYQYVGGAWKSKSAFVYRGSWTQISWEAFYLINDGKLANTGVTGGLTAGSPTYVPTHGAQGDGSYRIQSYGDGGSDDTIASLKFSNLIDLTDFSTLRIEGTFYRKGGAGKNTHSLELKDENNKSIAYVLLNTATDTVYQIDVSSVGKCYIYYNIVGYGGAYAYGNITNLYASQEAAT